MIAIIIVIICVTVLYLKLSFVRQLKSIKGKHVLITGGSSGIGKSVGIQAAKLGAHITILARDKTKLQSAEQEILQNCISSTQKIKAVSVDVTDHNVLNKILKDIDNELPVFMLINCAGMAICGVLEDMSISDIKKLVDLNFFGTLYSIRTLIPLMKDRNEGIVVITASQAALIGIYGMATYSATKYALRGLAEALEMEVRPYNISVTVSLPPDTDTPGFENENKNKPRETNLISESGGLFPPNIVAEKLINDALRGKFYSAIGFESFMLSTLCCGMTPFVSYVEVLIQTILLGPFRLISSFYILRFQKIIRECKNKV